MSRSCALVTGPRLPVSGWYGEPRPENHCAIGSEQQVEHGPQTRGPAEFAGGRLGSSQWYEAGAVAVFRSVSEGSLDRRRSVYGRLMPELRLEPMTSQEYATYRRSGEVSYASNIAASGALPMPEARRKAAEDYQRLLPAGMGTPGHRLWTAYEGEDPVGVLWLHLEEKSDGLHAFGYDFEVRQELRGKGYGRAMMLAAERTCGKLGVVSVGLSVFGSNLAARSLYEELGFEVTAVQMRKRL